MKIPKGFFPQQDTGFIFGQAEARRTPRLRRWQGLSTRSSTSSGRIRRFPACSISPGLRLQPDREHRPRVHPAEAARPARRTSDQVIQRLRPKVAAVEGVKFFMQSGQDISVGGRLSRTQYQYTLTDTDSDELNHWAPIVEAAMKKLPELQDVASDQQIAAPHLAIEIDRDAASRMGLSPR